MKLRFDTNGNVKQAQAAKYWADPDVTDLGYGGGKYGGKSFLGCNLIFGNALSYPGTHYVIARNELNDLVKFTIPSILEVFSLWEAQGFTKKHYRYNGNLHRFELYNDSMVYMLPVKYLPSDPDYQRLGSMQMTQVWGEEIGEWHPSAKANLLISTGRMKNQEYDLAPKGLFTFNPSRNFTYTDYYKPFIENNLPPHRRFVQALPTDNPKANPANLEIMRNSLSTNEYRRLFLGEWESGNDPNCLVDYDAVCDVFVNEHVIANKDVSARGLSTDLATSGRDSWIAFKWEGNVATLIVNENYANAKQIYEKTAEIARLEGIPRSRIVADSDGIGDFLGSFLDGIIRFHGGAKAIGKEDEKLQNVKRAEQIYFNLRSQCAYELAGLISERKIHIVIPGDSFEIKEKIKDELMLLIVKDLNDDASRKQLISKDLMKQKIGRSPDFLDALLMGMVLQIKPVSSGVKRSAGIITPKPY